MAMKELKWLWVIVVGNKLIFVLKKPTEQTQTMLPIVSVGQGGFSPTLVHFLANNALGIYMF